MNTTTVEALITKWRSEADNSWICSKSMYLRDCADELEAALSAQPDVGGDAAWFALIARIAEQVSCLPSTFAGGNEHVVRAVEHLATHPQAAPPKDLDAMQRALLWALYHHQGGSSVVGQVARRALGIGPFDNMTPEQIADAKQFAAISTQYDTPQADERMASIHEHGMSDVFSGQERAK